MFHAIHRNYLKGVVAVVLFMAVWLGLGWVFGWIWQQLDEGSWLTPPVAELIAGLIGEAAIVGTFFWGDAAALGLVSASKAGPKEYAQLHAVAESLAYGAGIPKPELYVIDDPSPNAFATGRDPEHASIAVTSGLLKEMSREELEGVLAHEVSHIKNNDVMLLLVVTMMVGLAAVLSVGAWESIPKSRSIATGATLVLVGLLCGVFGFMLGPFMQLALSRSRESLADAAGVELTRNPAGLLKALRRLADNDRPIKDYNSVTGAMLIDNPAEHHDAWFARWFDTHPPIEKRIAALEKISEVRET